ncbi:ribosomal protein S18-alanine N-acetyltransferase [Pelagibacterium xiamenense]|uniref:ribosomal protein S18-alanine N-acetyltransferase n=1 Tax=Pelagibacterium xiamenense TaxID=2901140 RepID=UPI001E2AC3EC|nr:ribosomal protein S18-alanine N-acetyltransferase [Pelagibacterium xiamenense]MCD7058510.1 ribosomal protein S18-alanine N-acetyltransferase [Pelagibacterium xiamenense]
MSYWTAPAGLFIGYGEPAHADHLARLHAQGFYRGWPRDDFEAYLADRLKTPAYVALDARRTPRGFAMLRLSGDECELLTIAVEKKLRGKGVGRALLAAAVSDLVTTPVRTMFLEVDETNLGAIKLYKNFGFTEIATRRGYYPKPDGSTATALVMRADLG